MPLDVARRGTLDVRDPPLKAIVAANDDYEAGYHKGNAGGLAAIDAELATANIKAGITIFGFAGNANVVDTSSGDAVAGDIRAGIKAWVDGAEVTGDIPEVAIVAGSEAVPAGIHTATTLSAIDGDLAVGNIKSGVIIFGFTGAATIQDISGADAGAGDVKDPKTFFSVTGAIKTGTMPTVALAAGANAYPAGYHAGEASLTAVDAHLAAGNIKDGVEIFGVTGTLVEGVDVSDANAAVGDVKSPKTFYSVAAPRKTGTMATRTLNAANDTVQAGYYAATTLSAVDVHLAPGNIKKDVNIFGKVGTFVADIDSLFTLGWLPAPGASVADFQVNPATGTFFGEVQKLNDNNTGQVAQADLNQYAEVDFGKAVAIQRWRQYGHALNNNNGVWKIQYYDLLTTSWTDWVTGISTRGASWSGLATETKELTTKIRLICTTADTGDLKSGIGELEVIY